MELTQEDFDERNARVEDGTADDEDNRLVKLYKREGYQKPRGGPVADTQAYDEQEEGDVDVPYEEWSRAELVTELKARKLKFSGKDDELVARLNENDAE